VRPIPDAAYKTVPEAAIALCSGVRSIASRFTWSESEVASPSWCGGVLVQAEGLKVVVQEALAAVQ
jgi:hypothetical protein